MLAELIIYCLLAALCGALAVWGVTHWIESRRARKYRAKLWTP